jgi:diadenylate cyclase
MNPFFQWIADHGKAILEMALISGGLFYAYHKLRPVSGARRLIELIVWLLAGFLFAYAFDLALIKTFLGFVVIGLVVLFQPELRHGFVSIVGHRLFTPAQNYRELIEQLEEAVVQLSAKRYGALFAIERGMDLKQFLETGVEIDGKFSPALIMTLFHPKTILHDGGMILKEGRVEGAGCVFPVSQRELLDRSIGLRHRAAMGITEQTDAIAIVVSEETGQISIARAGELEQALTPHLFKQRLTELLVMRKASTDGDRAAAITDRPPATKRIEA